MLWYMTVQDSRKDILIEIMTNANLITANALANITNYSKKTF